MVPGIGASPDRMLLGRIFSYHDTHLHRIGTNYQQLPVNSPRSAVHLGGGVERIIQERAIAIWQRVDADLGRRVGEGLGLVIPDRVRIPG